MFSMLPGYKSTSRVQEFGKAARHAISGFSETGLQGFTKGIIADIMARRQTILAGTLALYKLIPLRQRYIMTKGNRVRLRYVACIAAVLACVSSAAVFNVTGAFQQNSSYQTAMGPFPEGVVPAPQDFGAKIGTVIAGTFDNIITIPEGPHEQVVKVSSGDTMAGVLEKAGVGGKAAYEAVQAMSDHFDPRKVKAGQEVALKFDPVGESYELSEMKMKIDPVTDLVVSRQGTGTEESFTSQLQEKEVKEHTYAKMARIETSLYGSAARAGIPAPVIAEVIKIYSWNIDFQRDIQPDDKIEVLYNAYETEDGDFARFGNVQYASLTVGGKNLPIYRFEQEDGHYDYYDDKGQSIRATLMKTPVDGARISSGFGMRKHPVLGYSKMHKGMDFAAPTGTPIYAAGDATVEYAGRFSSYGNYVRLRHNGSLKTAYAHMHHIGKGIRVGSRVRQGDVIGYIGTTGRSTGPHLHYEVMVNNVQVNPKSIDLPTGDQLRGKDLERFKAIVRGMQKQYVAMVDGTSYAQRDTGTGNPVR